MPSYCGTMFLSKAKLSICEQTFSRQYHRYHEMADREKEKLSLGSPLDVLADSQGQSYKVVANDHVETQRDQKQLDIFLSQQAPHNHLPDGKNAHMGYIIEKCLLLCGALAVYARLPLHGSFLGQRRVSVAHNAFNVRAHPLCGLICTHPLFSCF